MTTDATIFLRGLLIGLSIAAPVGPIGLLCIRRTITTGRYSGLVSGLGAATADAVYGSIAGFGLTFISIFLLDRGLFLRLAGGAFLVYLGLKTIFTVPAKKAAQASGGSLVGDYFSTFFLTITNPLTILSFLAIFAGLGAVSNSGDYLAAALLVSGVYAGSALWWFMLSWGVSLFRNRFNILAMIWTNRISGAIISAFGIHILVDVLLEFL